MIAKISYDQYDNTTSVLKIDADDSTLLVILEDLVKNHTINKDILIDINAKRQKAHQIINLLSM